MTRTKSFCNNFGISDVSILPKECIDILENENVNLKELEALIRATHGDNVSTTNLIEYINSEHIKFILGFDIPNWKKMTFKEVFQEINKETQFGLLNYTEQCKFLEKYNIKDKVFVNYSLGIVYYKIENKNPE